MASTPQPSYFPNRFTPPRSAESPFLLGPRDSQSERISGTFICENSDRPVRSSEAWLRAPLQEWGSKSFLSGVPPQGGVLLFPVQACSWSGSFYCDLPGDWGAWLFQGWHFLRGGRPHAPRTARLFQQAAPSAQDPSVAPYEVGVPALPAGDAGFSPESPQLPGLPAKLPQGHPHHPVPAVGTRFLQLSEHPAGA